MAEHTPISPKGMTALVILLVVSGFINVSLISMVGIWSCEDEDLILDPVASTHDKNMVSHRNFGIVLDNSTEGLQNALVQILAGRYWKCLWQCSY